MITSLLLTGLSHTVFFPDKIWSFFRQKLSPFLIHCLTFFPKICWIICLQGSLKWRISKQNTTNKPKFPINWIWILGSYSFVLFLSEFQLRAERIKGLCTLCTDTDPSWAEAVFYCNTQLFFPLYLLVAAWTSGFLLYSMGYTPLLFF